MTGLIVERAPRRTRYQLEWHPGDPGGTCRAEYIALHG